MLPIFNKFSAFDSTKFQKEDCKAPDYKDLANRLGKTLYYGREAAGHLSKPLSDVTVDFYREATKKRLGSLDLDYAAEVARYTQVSPCALMMAFIYINRLKTQDPDYLDGTSSADLFLISLMMASKFLNDEGVDDELFNDEWAECGYVSKDHINEMEIDFLNAMDWRLFISSGEFSSMRHVIEAHIALRGGLERGWFTYTDLDILTQGVDLQEALKMVHATNKIFWNLLLTMFTCYGTVLAAALLSSVTTSAMLHVLSRCSHLVQPYSAHTSLTPPPLSNRTLIETHAQYSDQHEDLSPLANDIESVCLNFDCNETSPDVDISNVFSKNGVLQRRCCVSSKIALPLERYKIMDFFGQVKMGFTTNMPFLLVSNG